VSRQGAVERPVWALVGALALAAAGGADYVVFRLFDGNYFRWYLTAGPLIQLVVAGFALAVDLERHPLLISANPAMFLGEAFAVAGESHKSFSEDIRPRRTRPSAEDLPKAGVLDSVLASFFYVAFFATCLAWVAVIAPLQYVGNLVAGAPARLALASPVRTYALRMGKTTYLGHRPVDTLPEGAEEIGLARRPVAVTASISAGLLLAIGMFV
jgi:hypothetical protein